MLETVFSAKPAPGVGMTDGVILSGAPYRVRDKLRGVEESVWQQLLECLKGTPLPIHELFRLGNIFSVRVQQKRGAVFETSFFLVSPLEDWGLVWVLRFPAVAGLFVLSYQENRSRSRN
jgi:hypothetical protein